MASPVFGMAGKFGGDPNSLAAISPEHFQMLGQMGLLNDTQRAPQNVGEGLHSIGQSISQAYWRNKVLGSLQGQQTADAAAMRTAYGGGMAGPGPASSGASPPVIPAAQAAPAAPQPQYSSPPEQRPAIIGGAGVPPTASPASDGQPAMGMAVPRPAAVAPQAKPVGGMAVPASPTTPRAVAPISVADPRIGQVEGEMGRLRQAMTETTNPKLLTEFRARLDKLEGEHRALTDPKVAMDRRVSELAIRKAEKDLEEPGGKLTTVPEGGTLVMTDPRTGKHEVIAQGGPKIDATTKKAIDEADDFIAQTQTAIGALNEAMRLNGRAYSGIGASARAAAANNLVPWATPDAAATTNLENVVTNQALQSLRATFGGNPTEGERKILLDVAGSVNQPANVRADIYGRAMEMARQRLAINRQKAASLRSGSYYKDGGQPAAVDQQMNLSPHSDGGPVRVGTPEEAARLPPGTKFVTPDGQIRERH